MVNWKFGASVVVSAYIASTVGLNYDPEPKCCYVVCDESGCSEGFLPSSEAAKITVGVFVMLLSVARSAGFLNLFDAETIDTNADTGRDSDSELNDQRHSSVSCPE